MAAGRALSAEEAAQRAQEALVARRVGRGGLGEDAGEGVGPDLGPLFATKADAIRCVCVRMCCMQSLMRVCHLLIRTLPRNQDA
jgi:hypothetical protein